MPSRSRVASSLLDTDLNSHFWTTLNCVTETSGGVQKTIRPVLKLCCLSLKSLVPFTETSPDSLSVSTI